jgi:hypothetical protein
VVLGVELDVVSLEDLIIAKLEWAAHGGSERQLEDVAAPLRLWSDDMNQAYLMCWIHELGFESSLSRARGMI